MSHRTDLIQVDYQRLRERVDELLKSHLGNGRSYVGEGRHPSDSISMICKKVQDLLQKQQLRMSVKTIKRTLFENNSQSIKEANVAAFEQLCGCRPGEFHSQVSSIQLENTADAKSAPADRAPWIPDSIGAMKRVRLVAGFLGCQQSQRTSAVSNDQSRIAVIVNCTQILIWNIHSRSREWIYCPEFDAITVNFVGSRLLVSTTNDHRLVDLEKRLVTAMHPAYGVLTRVTIAHIAGHSPVAISISREGCMEILECREDQLSSAFKVDGSSDKIVDAAYVYPGTTVIRRISGRLEWIPAPYNPDDDTARMVRDRGCRYIAPSPHGRYLAASDDHSTIMLTFSERDVKSYTCGDWFSNSTAFSRDGDFACIHFPEMRTALLDLQQRSAININTSATPGYVGFGKTNRHLLIGEDSDLHVYVVKNDEIHPRSLTNTQIAAELPDVFTPTEYGRICVTLGNVRATSKFGEYLLIESDLGEVSLLFDPENTLDFPRGVVTPNAAVDLIRPTNEHSAGDEWAVALAASGTYAIASEEAFDLQTRRRRLVTSLSDILISARGGAPDPEGRLQALAQQCGGSQAVYPLGTSHLSLFDTRTNSKICDLAPTDSKFTAVAIAPSGNLACASTESGNIVVYHLPTGNRLRQFHAHAESITHLACVSDQVLASTGLDRVVKLWDLESDVVTRQYPLGAIPSGLAVQTGMLVVTDVANAVYRFSIED